MLFLCTATLHAQPTQPLCSSLGQADCTRILALIADVADYHCRLSRRHLPVRPHGEPGPELQGGALGGVGAADQGLLERGPPHQEGCAEGREARANNCQFPRCGGDQSPGAPGPANLAAWPGPYQKVPCVHFSAASRAASSLHVASCAAVSCHVMHAGQQTGCLGRTTLLEGRHTDASHTVSAQLSPEVRDLLDHILVPKEEERITIPDIEAHPWCVPRNSGASELAASRPVRATLAMCCIEHGPAGRMLHMPQCKCATADAAAVSMGASVCRRYKKKLPHSYEKAEKELEKDQAKVDQYIAGRSISPVRVLFLCLPLSVITLDQYITGQSISPVRLILCPPRSCLALLFRPCLPEGPSLSHLPAGSHFNHAAMRAGHMQELPTPV